MRIKKEEEVTPSPRTGSLYMPPSRRHALKKARPKLPKAGTTKPANSAYQRRALVAALRKRQIFKKVMAEARGKTRAPDPKVNKKEPEQSLISRVAMMLTGSGH